MLLLEKPLSMERVFCFLDLACALSIGSSDGGWDMSTIAPVANFEGTMKTVARRVVVPPSIPSVPINNIVLNNIQRNTPVLVGMGNAIKIYFSYNLPASVTEFKVGLYWLQRAKDKLEAISGGSTNTKNTPSRSADEVIRTMETPLGFAGGVNDAAFFDVSAAKVASGTPEVDNQEMRWQQIVMPLTSPPAADTIISPFVTGGVFASFAGMGVVYECIAKADELFLVSQTDPDTTLTNPAHFIGVDIAIGANAQGEQR